MKNEKIFQISPLHALLQILLGFTFATVVYLMFYAHTNVKTLIRSVNPYGHRYIVKDSAWQKTNLKWVAVNFEGNPITSEQLKADKQIKEHTIKTKDNLLQAANDNKILRQQVIYVKSHGSLNERLNMYLKEIGIQRRKSLQMKVKTNWNDVSKPVIIIPGYAKDFIRKISNSLIARIVVLPWTKETTNNGGNLLIENFYPWYGSNQLCKYLTTAQNVADEKAYWNTCTSNVTDTIKPEKVDKRYLNRRFWTLQTRDHVIDQKDPEYLTFIMLIKNGLVTSQGVIFTGKYKIVPFPRFVGFALKDTAGNVSATPEYDEVFVITQIFSRHFYHRNIEVFPKLAVYLDFLKANSHIKIHIGMAPMNALWKEMIGLDTKRYLHGPVKANLLYVPEPNYTGHTNPLPIQLLSRLYRTEIYKKYGHQKKDTIILINRSKSRVLKQSSLIKSNLVALAERLNMTFVQFNDNPVLPYGDAMKLFNRALLVFGPHGAGFTNLLYSEPGTFVIEALCEVPKSFLCYQSLSYALGHHYYGITANGNECPAKINLNMKEIHQLLVSVSSHLHT